MTRAAAAVFLVCCTVWVALVSADGAMAVTDAPTDINVPSLVVGSVVLAFYLGVTVAVTAYWFRKIRPFQDTVDPEVREYKSLP